MSRALPIHECFTTWQGEGCHLGRAAYFIRTFGCPVHCPWCDAAGTWHPDYIPTRVEKLMPQELARRAGASAAEIAVITGGEPAIHDLGPLCRALRATAGLPAHLETSGAFALSGAPDWVTVSPKEQAPPLPEVLACADEVKIIVDTPGSIAMWMERVAAHLRAACPVWLHPEWSRRADAGVLGAISEAVRTGWRGPDGHLWRFRAGWQVHKLYGVDARDAGSRAPVPLGGDPALGY